MILDIYSDLPSLQICIDGYPYHNSLFPCPQGQPPSDEALAQARHQGGPPLVYDSASGYFYDPNTGYYHDRATNLYYNGATGEYFAWNLARQEYMPAQNPHQPQQDPQDPVAPDQPSDASAPADDSRKKAMSARDIEKEMQRWQKQIEKRKQQDTSSRGFHPVGVPEAAASGFFFFF